MNEADMYAPLRRGANLAGWHLFRIADGAVGKAPADIAGAAPNGAAVLLEAKIQAVRPARPGAPCPYWPAYELHQVAWLARYAEVGAVALAVEHYAAQGLARAFVLRPRDFSVNGARAEDVRQYQQWKYFASAPAFADLALAGDRYVGWAEVLRVHLEEDPKP